jgi:hypothetical protein
LQRRSGGGRHGHPVGKDFDGPGRDGTFSLLAGQVAAAAPTAAAGGRRWRGEGAARSLLLEPDCHSAGQHHKLAHIVLLLLRFCLHFSFELKKERKKIFTLTLFSLARDILDMPSF